jgi:drug/metabolite transporter (DMT)-like permease
MYAYINPVIAVLLGAWLLGEPLGGRVVLASLLVLIGVAVVRTKGEGISFPLPASLRRLSAR